MSFAQTTLAAPRPASIRADVRLPRREPYFASPVDWRDEVLYFLLVDRFSDAAERPLLDRSRLPDARPAGWRWDEWARSGQERFQGGTLAAGAGSLGAGAIDDPEAEHKRSDFITLRDFRLSAQGLLTDLAFCYKYWIALTDCDGFRIDTLKHVSLEEARNFCGTVREFCANLGKANFLLVGEIAGGDFAQDRYLDVLERNLSAALDIGEMRPALTALAKGLARPGGYFGGFDPGNAVMGSHRNLGNRHVAVLDDHDHVFGQKLRFSAEAASDHQVAAGVAVLLFTLGIPCIYYGT